MFSRRTILPPALKFPAIGFRPLPFFVPVLPAGKISDGCSRRCAFCTIPLIRGPYHSFSFESIRNDVITKIQGGAKEIVLIAQDSGIWGLDMSPRETLASLLERLATEFSNTWFRVLYLQPAGITDELMRVMATYENICTLPQRRHR